MDIDQCVICGETEGAKNNLVNARLMTNAVVKCGHRFCQRCIDKEFLQKRQFFCKVCGIVVRRNTLTEKSILEIEVERDFKIRKRIKEIYNKTISDFDSHRDFCDYEEMVEDIIYNLTESIDVDETNAQVEQYKKENAGNIITQQTKYQEEIRNQQTNIQNEKKQMEQIQMSLQAASEQERKAKRDMRNQTNQVMLGDRDSVSLSSRFMNLSRAQEAPAQVTKNPSIPSHVQIFFMQREEPLPVFKQREDRTDVDAAEKEKLRRSAGGYDARITFKRNISEAMATLVAQKEVSNDNLPDSEDD